MRPISIDTNPIIGFGEFEPISFIILQGTSFCNLNCTYCYISEESRKQVQVFPLDSIEPIFSNVFKSSFLGKSLSVVWHEGEPLTLPIQYYEQFCQRLDQLVETLCPPDFKLSYYVQTNATLLTQEWCDFFKGLGERFDIGVSCDGPAFLHDIHRRNWSGQATHQKVQQGMELLRQNQLSFKVIAVLNEETFKHPQAFFDFFNEYHQNIRSLEFSLPELPNSSHLSETQENVLKEKYYDFLNTILELWKNSQKRLNILPFQRLYHLIYNLHEPQKRTTRPFHALNIDNKGNISTFTGGLGFYFGDTFSLYPEGTFLGNLHTDRLDDIALSEKCLKMCRDFEISKEACRSGCDYFPLCGGGNPIEKYEKNGRIDSTETASCRLDIQIPANLILNEINGSTAV